MLTHSCPSASSSLIEAKFALPTPTIMMDIGRRDARMMACFVSFMSLNTPSVNISKTKYCCDRERGTAGVWLTYSCHLHLEVRIITRAAVLGTLPTPDSLSMCWHWLLSSSYLVCTCIHQNLVRLTFHHTRTHTRMHAYMHACTHTHMHTQHTHAHATCTHTCRGNLLGCLGSLQLPQQSLPRGGWLGLHWLDPRAPHSEGPCGRPPPHQKSRSSMGSGGCHSEQTREKPENIIIIGFCSYASQLN